nr:flagellar hook-length control protein FliK [Szabonella alba]
MADSTPLSLANRIKADPTSAPGPGAAALAEVPLRFLPGSAAPPAPQSQPPTVPPEHLATVIAQRSASGPGMTELSLAPEELGRLRIQLTPEGDRIRIVLSAELPETLDLLRRSVTEFTEDLRRMGFASASFDFAGWDGRQGTASPPFVVDPEADSGAGPKAAEAPLVLHLAAPRSAGLDLRL